MASGEFLNGFPGLSGRGPVPAEVEGRARGDLEDPGYPAKAQAPVPQRPQLVEVNLGAWSASCGSSQERLPPGSPARALQSQPFV